MGYVIRGLFEGVGVVCVLLCFWFDVGPLCGRALCGSICVCYCVVICRVGVV